MTSNIKVPEQITWMLKICCKLCYYCSPKVNSLNNSAETALEILVHLSYSLKFVP